LGDHFDPRDHVLRLSPDVYEGRTLSAIGVAAHEAGHAIQQATGYAPLALRNGLVPVAQFGTNAAWVLILAGLAIYSLRFLAVVGLIIFGVATLFQLITLPVEIDASRRARQALLAN